MMKYDELISSLHKARDPLEVFAAVRASTIGPKPSKDEIDKALSSLAQAFERNRVGRALSVGRAILILLGSQKALARIHREGLFRASRHAFDCPAALAVIRDWLKNAAQYELDDSDISYLESAVALWSLADELKALRRSLVARLRGARQTVVKTLLAHLDLAFSYQENAHQEFSTDSPGDYPIESMAEAFSYIFRLFHSEIGLTSSQFQVIDRDAVSNTFHQDLLFDAAKICEYLEAEVLIASFPYSAKEFQDGVQVASSDSALERSVRIGYAQMEMQQGIRQLGLLTSRSVSKPTVASIVHVAEGLYGLPGDKFVSLKLHPVPRYVLAVPMLPPIIDLFGGNSLLLEDMASLEFLGNEDYVEPHQIVHVPVKGNITVLDILKIQRFFHFLQFGLRKAIDGHTPIVDRTALYLMSSIPVFEREYFLSLFRSVLGEEKAEEALVLLSCDLGSDYVDIQYTPIVAVGEWCMLSVAVFARSNLVRNLLCHNDTRLTMRDKGDADPMVVALTDALREAGFLVEAEVKTKNSKTDSLEVDVLAFRDGHLFIFECKNSYHPCNVYERRTSYGHVVYASTQLTKRKAWLSQPTVQEEVFKKISWNASPTANVHTCIAIGNRVFSGYDCDGHPVRQVHEMINLLVRGTIVRGDQVRRLWKHEKFAVDDLCEYVAGNLVTADFIASTRALDRQVLFSKRSLVFSTFELDLHKLAGIADARYPLQSTINKNPGSESPTLLTSA